MNFRLPEGRVCVMGVLNVTPDSFSDGGEHFNTAAAIAWGEKMSAVGADIVDVGGESTRPGAEPVSEEEELNRVMPVIRALAARQIPVSIDTSKPAVALAAVLAGASVINDVTGLRDPAMLAAAAQTGATVCIMHMLGEPRTMQQNPVYDDVVEDVTTELRIRADAATLAGIPAERIWLDPGIGFGKTLEHNLALLRGLPRLGSLGYPILIGVSRKSFIGKLTNTDSPQSRLPGSLAAALFAVSRGARILRAHDVAETVQALRVWQALATPVAL